MRYPALLALLVLGCSKPGVTSRKAVVSGTPVQEVQLDRDHRLWVYAPGGTTNGKPCVVIAPAGAHMFDGMKLGGGDSPEHTPYLKAGYVVVAYDVSGPMANDSTEEAIRAARTFTEAKAGVDDGRRAIDYALTKLQVDPARLAVAGHSSAATIALTLAENEPRVKACLAYAPVMDVPNRLGDVLDLLQPEVPGIKETLHRYSPLGNPQGLKCPTLLFYAKDDERAQTAQFADFAKKNATVDLAMVASGGHYDSMIQEGIPMGLKFLKTHRLAP